MINTPITLHDLRERIYIKAKADKTWRFWGLYVHVCKLDTLFEAYLMARKNNGAPGIDGVTFEAIEESGVQEFLEKIHGEFVSETYRPTPNRKKEIPKGGGKVRTLGIPCIRDRVVQGALKLALPQITGILPGAGAPTVTPLAGRDDYVAVHAVCQESVFWETLEQLKAAGRLGDPGDEYREDDVRRLLETSELVRPEPRRAPRRARKAGPPPRRDGDRNRAPHPGGGRSAKAKPPSPAGPSAWTGRRRGRWSSTPRRWPKRAPRSTPATSKRWSSRSTMCACSMPRSGRRRNR